jgi:hypothetical protein
MRLAILLLATATFPARAAPPPAAVAAAAALAKEVGPPPEGRRSLRLAVEAPAPALARTVETALDAALSGLGYAVTPHRGGSDAEAAARAARQEWLLRVRAGLVPGGSALVLAGDLVPTWASFFQQRRPEARAVPPRVVQARVAADDETRLLARAERPGGAPFAVVRTLGRLPGRVLALAIGDLESRGHPALVAVTPDAVVVLGPDAAPVAVRRAAPGRATPVRDPAAAVAVGDFGGGRIAVRRAGEPLGEVLALHGGALEPAGTIDAAPLCAGGAGPLFGAFAAGTGVFVDVLSSLVDPAARPRSARLLYGASAAPGGGPVAYAVLGTDLALALLGPDLAPVRGLPALPPAEPGGDGRGGARRVTGSGFALADLDGDGTAELVASSPSPRGPDRIRVLAPLAKAPLLLEFGPIEGAILAAAGGDLTGDGVDDAVVATVATGDDGAPVSTLLLVTADPRELR